MKSSQHLLAPKESSHEHGFSLIEILIAITVIGVLATIGMVATGNIASVAKSEKLRSDVATINSAIDTYLANGGSLDAITTADAVLAKLKTQRDAADARRHTGSPSGRMIDPRIVALPVDAADRQLKAYYDPASRRFEIIEIGAGFRFDLDPSLNEMNISIESRDHRALAYAESDPWVWNYNASLTNPNNLPNVTTIPVSAAPADSSPSAGGVSGEEEEGEEEVGEPPVDPRAILPTPVLEPPGGTYPAGKFPLAVTIGNTPPPAIGKVQFATQFNGAFTDWADYSGQILSVPKDGAIQARAIALDTANYRDSGQAYGQYRIPAPPKLPTPIFGLPGGAYPRDSFPISVALTNRPAPGLAEALYRLDSGPWTPYAGPVVVAKNQNLSAQYVTRDADAYATSSIRSDRYYPIATNLSGNVTGAFQNAGGGPTLVHEIDTDGTFFSHGDPTINLGGEIVDAGEPNTLLFLPRNFSGISPNTHFKIGDLAYHNGTTFNDSHATGVQLQIQIALADPAQQIQFALDFELVNTENTGDARASADYVRITNLTQNIGLMIDGVNYALRLEFGGTDSFGFSTSNEFHVYEGATGTGAINGTFIANP